MRYKIKADSVIMSLKNEQIRGTYRSNNGTGSFISICFLSTRLAGGAGDLGFT